MNKKNQTFYLIKVLLLGLRAKIISLLSKIIMNRTLGVEAIGIFSLVNPIIVLLISLSNLSLPNAVSTLISKNPKKDKQILISSFLIFILVSTLLMSLTFLFDEFISNIILKNPKALYAIRASIIMIPLTSLSAIIKGYYLGKGEITLTSSSQTFEEAGRLLFILIISYLFINFPNSIKASFAVYSLAFGEIFQISYMILFSSTNKKNIIKEFKRNFNDSKKEIKPILNISIPLTLSRLVGSLTYCLEPIIFTNVMLKNGFTTDYITIEYGILTSYVMPLLFMPSFISLALSNYLIPSMGKLIYKKKENESIKLLFKIIILSLLIGLIISICFFIFGKFILIFLYDKSVGIKYLKLLCFPFIIYYIESPIIAALSVFELTKQSFISTVVSSIFRIILLFPFIKLFGVLGITISTLISAIIDISMNSIFLLVYFKRNNIKLIN